MKILLLAAAYCIVVLVSWSIVGWTRRYALRRTILDIPNHRSLHASPTPRGGGIAIVIPVLVVTVLLSLADLVPLQTAIAITGGGLIVAIVGWIDDIRSVPALLRFACYLGAAVWACYWILPVTGESGTYVTVTYLFWILALGWMTNLYNFMDGTDALAATQGIFAALTAALLLLVSGQAGIALLLWVLAASSTGFLLWNWPPARIFMGDTGSCFIGYLFGLLVMQTDVQQFLSPAVWLILLAVFITDASLTLIKRITNGEKWYSAHRSHAYQLAVQSGLTHRQLIKHVLMIFLLILLPLALIAFYQEQYRWELAVLTYIMVSIIWLLIQSRSHRNVTGTE